MVHNFTIGAERYQALSAFSLPEAAVVIDVRHCPPRDEPLLTYLHTELRDLEVEMRHKHVSGWSQLAECISFLSLDAPSTSTVLHNTTHFFMEQGHAEQAIPLDEMTDFVVQSPSAPPVTFVGRMALTEYLCTHIIDRARDARIRAMASFMQENLEGTVSATTFNTPSTIRPTTVRVFFLADMQDHASLIRAATYARWLKERTDETHGLRRFDRDERLQNIIVCLNVHSAHYQGILLETIGTLPDDTIQTIILLESYAENEAHIDEQEQVYHADLLLYTLLLHWPDTFITAIEDPVQSHRHYVREARFLPWPTFIVGIAAMEYSARWAARWLDYGITDQLLFRMTDDEAVKTENLTIKHDMQTWLDHWWEEMQTNVPDAMQMDVDQLQALTCVQDTMRPSRLLNSTPRTIATTLHSLQQDMSLLYTGNGRDHLPYALRYGSDALLTRWKPTTNASVTIEQSANNEQYAPLHHLYHEAQECIAQHYQKVEGAFPRAIRQLHALSDSITTTIQHVALTPPDMHRFQEQFEQQARLSEKKLAHTYRLWTLPIIGQVLQTTALCVLLALVLAIVLLTDVNWTVLFEKLESLVGHTPTAPSSLSLHLWDVLLVLLLIGCVWMYVSAQKRAFQRDCKTTYRQLSQVVEQQMTQVKATIAAQVALSFLQSAHLYQPQAPTSVYEQRLQAGEQRLKHLQKEAQLRYRQAETRLRYLDTGQEGRVMPGKPPLVLDNRNEFIQWEQVIQGLLHADESLKKNDEALEKQGAIFDMLTEMLLRQMGTERPEALLNSVLSRHYGPTEITSDIRFQALETLFVAFTLLAPLTKIEPADVFPLLQQYKRLKALKQEEMEMEEEGPGEHGPELSLIVQKSLISAIQGHAVHTNLPSSLPSSATEEQTMNFQVLTSWVGRQRSMTPLSAQLFTLNDVLARLAAQKDSLQHFQGIDTLSQQGKLLGHPDKQFGEDTYYLFFAPGEASKDFLDANQSLQRVRIHPAVIPDYEKLVYLHIHRIRQIVIE